MYISDPTTDQTQSPLQVALLGDSVLDDFYWLHDKERDVRRQIEDLLVKVGLLFQPQTQPETRQKPMFQLCC